MAAGSHRCTPQPSSFRHGLLDTPIAFLPVGDRPNASAAQHQQHADHWVDNVPAAQKMHVHWATSRTRPVCTRAGVPSTCQSSRPILSQIPSALKTHSLVFTCQEAQSQTLQNAMCRPTQRSRQTPTQVCCLRPAVMRTPHRAAKQTDKQVVCHVGGLAAKTSGA